LQNILSIFHVPSFYNKLHLVDALSARIQTRFGIGQTVKRFSQAYITHMAHHFLVQLFANVVI